jgi:nicotinate-nucleotide adenylyltransferase
MRIALYGGSFDPPHSGHIGIAMAAVERLHLDRVLMAPVGRQPLKQEQVQSPFEDRMVMVQLACAGHPPLAASAVDAPHLDGRYNYTYDTLERLRETLPAGDELFCLVGADSLQTLHQWHRATEALMLGRHARRPTGAWRRLAMHVPDQAARIASRKFAIRNALVAPRVALRSLGH